MRANRHGSFTRQLGTLRQQFLQVGRLPFTDVLSAEIVSEALEQIKVQWYDRIFSPLVTLWVFLEQVLNPDQSCRAAVAKLIAHRLAQRLPACSSETGAYCQARKRLPLSFFSNVGRRVGEALDSRAKREWLWKGRRVHLFDGSSVTMPETPQNRKEFLLTYNQKLGGAFPFRTLPRSFRSLAMRSSTWESTGIQGGDKANRACFARCGIPSAQAT